MRKWITYHAGKVDACSCRCLSPSATYKWSTWRLYQGEQGTGERELSPASGTPRKISAHLRDTRASREKVRWKTRRKQHARVIWSSKSHAKGFSTTGIEHTTITMREYTCTPHTPIREQHTAYSARLTATSRTDRHRFYQRSPDISYNTLDFRYARDITAIYSAAIAIRAVRRQVQHAATSWWCAASRDRERDTYFHRVNRIIMTLCIDPCDISEIICSFVTHFRRSLFDRIIETQ